MTKLNLGNIEFAVRLRGATLSPIAKKKILEEFPELEDTKEKGYTITWRGDVYIQMNNIGDLSMVGHRIEVEYLAKKVVKDIISLNLGYPIAMFAEIFYDFTESSYDHILKTMGLKISRSSKWKPLGKPQEVGLLLNYDWNPLIEFRYDNLVSRYVLDISFYKTLPRDVEEAYNWIEKKFDKGEEILLWMVSPAPTVNSATK